MDLSYINLSKPTSIFYYIGIALFPATVNVATRYIHINIYRNVRRNIKLGSKSEIQLKRT